jgi:hypothetical protein
MMYPKNWIAKYLRDAMLSEVEVDLVDSIDVPLVKFLHE